MSIFKDENINELFEWINETNVAETHLSNKIKNYVKLTNIFPPIEYITESQEYIFLLKMHNNYDIDKFILDVQTELSDFVIPIILEYYELDDIFMSKSPIYKNININKILLNLCCKIKSKNDENYKLLSTNVHIRCMINIRTLFKTYYKLVNEYFIETNELPKIGDIYKNEDIGTWLHIIVKFMNNGNIEIFDKLSKYNNKLCKIIIIKLCNIDHFMNFLLQDFYKYNLHLKINSIYKDVNIGLWFYNKIKNIESSNDPLVKELGINDNTRKIINIQIYYKELEMDMKKESIKLSNSTDTIIFNENIFMYNYLK
jgi:hypothetical protein